MAANDSQQPGRREQRKAATRLAIIRAAIELAAAESYAQTTIEAIAGRAGVSAATVFNYFPTKLDVFFADADRYAHVPPLTPGPSPHHTAGQAILTLAHSEQWTLSLDDALTRTWFALIEREPELAAHRTNLMLAAVPHLARALGASHPDLPYLDAVAIAGAALGAFASVLSHAAGPLEDRLAAAARASIPPGVSPPRRQRRRTEISPGNS